jgi:cytochrome P450
MSTTPRLDCPVAWPQPDEGRGLGTPPTYDAELGAWVLSRFADVDRVLRDEAGFSSRFVTGPNRRDVFAPLLADVSGDPRVAKASVFFEILLLSSDGPAHTRVRGFVKTAFTPRRVRVMEEAIAALCDELTEPLLGRGDVRFVEEFAIPLPVRTIASALGIPPDDFLDFRRWTHTMVELFASPAPTAQQLDRFLDVAVELTDYFAPLIEERRARPKDDLISALSGVNEAGERLAIGEILELCKEFLTAGNHTTTRALTGTMLYLVRTPGLQDEVRRDPALLTSVVEEGLRLSSPIQVFYRSATADAEVGGVTIARGEHLFLRYAAANRDGARFSAPLIPDPTRKDKRHLSFGRGVHVCPGAPLARAEMRIALETLLHRSSAIALADREGAVIPAGHELTASVGELHLRVSG